MANVYQMVTDRIIEQLNQGIIPWKQPWTVTAFGEAGAINYVSRRPYSLLNQFLLGKPGEWLTFTQIKALKGSIKKGAKSRFVVFYTQYKFTETQVTESGETVEKEKTIPLLRYYNVFHLSDVEGLQTKIGPGDVREHEPIEEAERVISEYLARESGLTFKPKKGDRAYYSPAQDMVVVPLLSQYKVKEEYYSTTFHELTHSTMTEGRCNRKAENENAFFGNEDYSREELVAEIGSAMLCNRVGIECKKAFKNSVAYIQSWLKALKNDQKMIVWAAGRAEKAAKFILNEI